MNEHFYNGFIKRAQDYGLSAVEADRLIKAAEPAESRNGYAKGYVSGAEREEMLGQIKDLKSQAKNYNIPEIWESPNSREALNAFLPEWKKAGGPILPRQGHPGLDANKYIDNPDTDFHSAFSAWLHNAHAPLHNMRNKADELASRIGAPLSYGGIHNPNSGNTLGGPYKNLKPGVVPEELQRRGKLMDLKQFADPKFIGPKEQPVFPPDYYGEGYQSRNPFDPDKFRKTPLRDRSIISDLVR